MTDGGYTSRRNRYPARPMVARCCQCHALFALPKEGAVRCPECDTQLWAGEGGPSPAEMALAREDETYAPPPQLHEAGELPRRQAPPPLMAPFEDPERALAERFRDTLMLVLTRPRAFFARLAPEGEEGITLFAWLAVSPAFAVASFFALLRVYSMEQAPLASDPAWAQTPFADIAVIREIYAWQLVLSPLVGYIFLHIAAGLYQLGIATFAGPGHSYTTTFRATVFGMAPMVLWAFPVIGPPVAVVWTAWTHIIALATMHSLPTRGVGLMLLLVWLGFTVLVMTVLASLLSAGGWAPAAPAV